MRWLEDTGSIGVDYGNFRAYLDNVFTYAGTASLEREMRPVSLAQIQPGDVWIQGGYPGHAVLVLDVAQKPGSDEKLFLLAQSYMPAQDFHVLVNPQDATLSPWYAAEFDDELHTPEWSFSKSDLRRF